MTTPKKPLTLRGLVDEFLVQEAEIREGGGEKGQERQRRSGRLFVRERLQKLLDQDSPFIELGLWAAHGMYKEWGDLPAAGLVTGIGNISGRPCMIVANDATVKAGAMFPQSIKKFLRAQRIAYECRLPLFYLVDSSGVFLPLQDEIFPDEDDFGRIFRNNSVLSADGIPQIAAVMGNCIAGGAYLPVLCDTLLMTEGSAMCLAGPALVKSAIGQEVEMEELGGPKMHSEISGTADFYEPNDESCLKRLRSLAETLEGGAVEDPLLSESVDQEVPGFSTEKGPYEIYDLVGVNGSKQFDVRDVIRCLVDQGSMDEYKATYGQTLVNVYAKIGGSSVGIVANQRKTVQSQKEGIQIGGVIYADSADKAARFVMDCNQKKIPLVFLQDVVGFMVGREAEQSGIIRCGAKLVNAVSNCVVPKITIVIGASYGAGNYGMCGKAYDPTFILAWPNAKYAVMGADQAAGTLAFIQERAAKRDGHELDKEEAERMRQEVKENYLKQMDIRYGAARGWIDAIIPPHTTRFVLANLLRLVRRAPLKGPHFHTGVLQV